MQYIVNYNIYNEYYYNINNERRFQLCGEPKIAIAVEEIADNKMPS